MIAPIPDQPIDFLPGQALSCCPDPLDPPLLFDPERDELIFQIRVQDCGVNEIENPNFEGTNWKGGLAWTLFPGEACGAGIAGTSLEETGFVPTIGSEYTITFTITSARDTCTWSFGGQSGTLGEFGTLTGPTTVTVSVTATGTGGLTITLDTMDSAICLALISVVEASRDITVEIMDGEDVIESFNPATEPEAFTFTGGVMVFNSFLDDEGLPDCFTVRVTEDCENTDTVLESQRITRTNSECTLKIRACNGEGLGFIAPLELRFNGSLGRPSWEYDVAQERRSNGRIIRHYADAERKAQLLVGLQSQHVHRFMSKLPLFGSVFVEQTEYVVDADGYEPEYSDIFMGTASIQLVLRPKQELRRTVLCGPEPPSCPPPPNLWVQGTGPNNDHVLTQLGDTVLLKD